MEAKGPGHRSPVKAGRRLRRPAHGASLDRSSWSGSGLPSAYG
jgi:transposase